MKRIGFLFVSLTVCVISYVSALNSEAIIGGDKASKNQFPYQISLQVKGRNYCGGAILSDTFILTAAHCVIKKATNTFEHHAYKIVANTLDSKIKPIQVDVDKIYVLKDYNPELVTNDIAVLKLKVPLNLENNKIQAINLPSANEEYVGVKAVISGYGWNDIKINYNPIAKNKKEVGSSDGKLRYIAVDILSNVDCELNNYPQDIPATKICGKAVQRNKINKSEGTCFGDSGSPLVYNNVVIGIVSIGPFGCNESRQAAVYTRVSAFLPFIQGVMDGHVNPNVREHKVL